jgi:hypothetical protein
LPNLNQKIFETFNGMLYATLLLYRKEKHLLLTRNGFCAFSIYTFVQSYGGVDGDSASSTDEGIEILTGKDAGENNRTRLISKEPSISWSMKS